MENPNLTVVSSQGFRKPLPSQQKINAIKTGDTVKVLRNQERFWVEITEADSSKKAGIVMNNLIHNPEKVGDSIIIDGLKVIEILPEEKKWFHEELMNFWFELWRDLNHEATPKAMVEAQNLTDLFLENGWLLKFDSNSLIWAFWLKEEKATKKEKEKVLEIFKEREVNFGSTPKKILEDYKKIIF